MTLPAGFSERSLTDKRFKLSGDLDKKGPVVLLAGGETSDLTDTAEHPPGTVVVLDSDDDKAYRADSVNGGDRHAAAEIRSAEAPDGDWASKTLAWSVYYPDGTVVGGAVAIAADDDSVDEVRDVLNADALFAAHLIASSDTQLVITSRAKGAVRVYVSLNLDTGFGTDDGSSSSAVAEGTEAKYFVTQHWAYLKDGNNDRDYLVKTLRAGDFDTSELSGLTNEARAYLRSMGSQFD